MSIVHPVYYRVFRKSGSQWLVHTSKLLNSNASAGIQDLRQYGLTIEALVISFFKINAGKEGYYIANLKDKNFYYCGLAIEDVKAKFLDLGCIPKESLN